MTSIGEMLDQNARAKLLHRLAELQALDHLVRERSGVRPPDPPVPLGKPARAEDAA
jgi:hypothetical protein